MRTWSFEKQLKWSYALNEIYGKDKETLDKISAKAKAAAANPPSVKSSLPQVPKRPGAITTTTGKRFTKTGKGTMKTELI